MYCKGSPFLQARKGFFWGSYSYVSLLYFVHYWCTFLLLLNKVNWIEHAKYFLRSFVGRSLGWFKTCKLLATFHIIFWKNSSTSISLMDIPNTTKRSHEKCSRTTNGRYKFEFYINCISHPNTTKHYTISDTKSLADTSFNLCFFPPPFKFCFRSFP